MTKIFLIVLVTFFNPAAAQKQKPVKDTAAFLRSAFKNAWGEKKVSENGKHVYTNHYTVTAIAVKGCILEATVKMKYIAAGTDPYTYTLTYSIPLKDIYSIKPLTDITKDGLQNQYTGAPIEFLVGINRFAIKYKMVEDLTGRIEANAGYNESTLWCDPKKSKQLLEVLNALLKSCRPIRTVSLP